jgi:hypothetical protein
MPQLLQYSQGFPLELFRPFQLALIIGQTSQTIEATGKRRLMKSYFECF